MGLLVKNVKATLSSLWMSASSSASSSDQGISDAASFTPSSTNGAAASSMMGHVHASCAGSTSCGVMSGGASCTCRARCTRPERPRIAKSWRMNPAAALISLATRVSSVSSTSSPPS